MAEGVEIPAPADVDQEAQVQSFPGEVVANAHGVIGKHRSDGNQVGGLLPVTTGSHHFVSVIVIDEIMTPDHSISITQAGPQENTPEGSPLDIQRLEISEKLHQLVVHLGVVHAERPLEIAHPYGHQAQRGLYPLIDHLPGVDILGSIPGGL